MKTFITTLLLLLTSVTAFATGEPATYFNIFLPPNNDPVLRNVCLIVTAIYDSTTFQITDDNADGDNDDSKTGVLMAGQSYILYIKDNGINDDARYASGGVWKQDGDYFIITSSKLVYASQSTDSDWQHDWVPSVNKSSCGEKFIIYSPKNSSSFRDVNVMVYEDQTTVTIRKISLSATTQTGYTHVDGESQTVVAQRTLNRGQDLIYAYAEGRNLLAPGETYVVETNKAITVQYGALYVNERDGGGYVPSSNGSSAGSLFYFAVPYQATGEQEIRIVSWNPDNAVTLERYSAGSWISMKTWTVQQQKAVDWVGKSNGNVSYPTIFRVTCSQGKKVSVFEANWLETGSPGTSDIATMVSAETGTSAGHTFLTYMAPPGNEQNVRNPFTGQLFGQRLTHVYLFSRDTAHVTVKDAYSNGGEINRSYTILPGRYTDCYLTENEWKMIYNGTGTTAGPERPYLLINSDEPISVMSTNFNDNWMMYFGSSQEQKFSQVCTSSASSGIPGDTITINSKLVFSGSGVVDSPEVKIVVGSGATVLSASVTDSTTGINYPGVISRLPESSVTTFYNLPDLNATHVYQTSARVKLAVAYNDGSLVPNNTVVSVETIFTGRIGGVLEQSVATQGLRSNTANMANLIFTQVQTGAVTTDLTDSWSTAWTDYDSDGDDDLFITDKRQDQPNRLYRNNGNASFTPIATGALVTDKAVSVTSAWADTDNDGDQDVVVANDTRSPSFSYTNNGNGTFTRTQPAFATETGYFHGASWSDVNHDGRLDLFLGNYMRTRFSELYFGDSTGTFTLQPAAAPCATAMVAVGSTWCDYDGDGYEDLFVPNDQGGTNELFRNDGKGGFERVRNSVVVQEGGASTGACWGDYDRDGDMDLYVTNASNTANYLYQNTGNGSFAKITTGALVTDRGDSHGCSWADADNDGDLDLYVSNDNGFQQFYLNTNGTFTLKTDEAVSANLPKAMSHAWSDLDNDGDLDLFVATHSGKKNFLFTNNGNSNRFLKIRLRGRYSNASAIGARVRVKAGGVWQVRDVASQHGLGGQSSLTLHFGMGASLVADSIVIAWPSGVRQVITTQNTNQTLNVVEEAATLVTGYLYQDDNQNCQREFGENSLANREAVVQPGNIHVFSDYYGQYSLRLMPGTYTLRALKPAGWASACPETSFSVNAGDAIAAGPDAGISPTSLSADLHVEAGTTPLRRGFTAPLTLICRNTGAGLSVADTLFADFGPHLIPVSTSLPAVYQQGTVYGWVMPVMLPGAVFSLTLMDSVALSTSIGDTLNMAFRASAAPGEGDLTNNSLALNEVVVGAIDPNDMLVSPRGAGTDGYISPDDSLTYTVRFQNIGTYYASRVRVSCALPAELDPASFLPLGNSHDFRLTVTGRELVWEARGIHLPDSTTDEPGSHGFIRFQIKPVKGLSAGSRIFNAASIQFDYEDPLITNTVLNTLGKQAVALDDRVVEAWPNPATANLSVRVISTDPACPQPVALKGITLTDLSGKTMIRQPLTGYEGSVSVSGLLPGVYLVTVTDTSGAGHTARVVVE